MSSEQGICSQCGQMKECIPLDKGWICTKCFMKILEREPRSHGKYERAMLAPKDPMRKVWIFVDGKGAYVTIKSVLYAFDRKEDAEESLANVKSSGARDVEDVTIAEEPCIKPFVYVYNHPPLRIAGVKKLIRKEDQSA